MMYTIKAKNKTVVVDLAEVVAVTFYSDEVVLYLKSGKTLAAEIEAIDERDFLETWGESSKFWVKR